MDTSLIPGSVVVGVDGSPGSDIAVVWAAQQAEARHHPLAIVHGTGYPAVTDVTYDIPEARAARQTEGQRVADAAAALAQRTVPGVQVSSQVTAADPRALLAETAAHGSLLVMGARGHGPLTSLLLGSVSSALAAQPPGPVVVVRAVPEGKDAATLPVVVGIDGTDASAGAIGFAYEMASWQNRPLEVIYALSTANTYSYHEVRTEETVRRLRTECELRIAESLAGYAEKFPDVTAKTTLSTESAPRALRQASQTAYVVVVGTRGRGPVARRFLGSVSRSIVERGSCTVAVVPGGSS